MFTTTCPNATLLGAAKCERPSPMCLRCDFGSFFVRGFFTPDGLDSFGEDHCF